MAELEFLDYEEITHKTDYLNMFLEYGKGLDDQVVNTYGYHLIPEGNIKKLAERLVPQFTSYDKSEEVLLILKIDGKTAGTARLDKFAKDIGNVHQVFIYPEFRGNGYSKQLMYVLEERARKFGYSYLRLDTGGFNVVAQNLYRKLGYVEIERFTPVSGLENEKTRQYFNEKVHMEKKL